MAEIVDMGIARMEDLRKIENPHPCLRAILAEPDYGFDWVAWVEGSGPAFGWTFFSDQLIERAAMGQQRVFELAVSDAIAELDRQQAAGLN